MISHNVLVVLVGVSVLGACAGMVGCFATLRRRALTGDALAHAALPGLCLAFLISGQRSMPILLLGAFLSGLVGVGIIALLRRYTRVKEDAAIGIVLSVFFGAGIVLVRLIQNQTTAASKAGLESYIFGKTASMVTQDVYLIAGVAALCLVVIGVLYKELKLVVFDPDFARAQGWPTLTLDLLLMTLMAVVVVIGLPAVGVVLIAALLIIPSVAARFWSERLGILLLLSALLGALTGLVGAWLSANSEHLPAGAIIVLVGTGIFILSALAAPRRGLAGRWLAQQRFRRALEERKLLRVLYELSEPSPAGRPLLALDAIRPLRAWKEAQLRRLLRWCRQEGLLEETPADQGPRYRLTEEGLRQAAEVTRQHRLWQTFLTEYPDQASVNVSLSLTPIEELLPEPLLEELTGKLRRGGRLPLAGDAPLAQAGSVRGHQS